MNVIDNESWRLVTDILCYVNDTEKKLYIISSEKKTYESAVAKTIPDIYSYTRKVLGNNEFNLRVDERFNVYVKSEEFPKKDEFYRVVNVWSGKENLFFGELFSNLVSDKGCFGDSVFFEPIFSDTHPTEVFLVAQGTEFYKTAFEEMKRRINCQICKKTKKWIPGHRYDSLEKTYYYLGEFESRKANSVNSDFLDDNNVVTAYLVVQTIPEGTKKISEIFNKFIYTSSVEGGKDKIEILYTSTLPSMVDSGKVLENDVKDVQDYWETLVDNTIKSCGVVNDFGYNSYMISGVESLMNIFSIQSSENLGYNLSETTKTRIEEYIKSLLQENILLWWNLGSSNSSTVINRSKSLEDNKKNLENLFFRNLREENLKKNVYYLELWKAMGIEDFDKLVEISILNNDPEAIVFRGGFKNYIKYGSIYYKGHEIYDIQSKFMCQQRIDSTNYKLQVTKMSDVFEKAPHLENVIREIVKEARENFGHGVNKFTYTNVGNRKDPKIYTSIEITINDIIKFCGNENNVPEEVINEIIDSHFWTFNLVIDKDKELE